MEIVYLSEFEPGSCWYFVMGVAGGDCRTQREGLLKMEQVNKNEAEK